MQRSQTFDGFPTFIFWTDAKAYRYVNEPLRQKSLCRVIKLRLGSKCEAVRPVLSEV